MTQLKFATNMASCSFPFPATIRCRRAPPSNHSSTAAASFDQITTGSLPGGVSLQRSFLFKRNSRPGRCRATSPPSEPPSNECSPSPSGVRATLTRFQDTLQIFFTVLFWMSLFFWSSVWDGRSGGGPNKGS